MTPYINDFLAGCGLNAQYAMYQNAVISFLNTILETSGHGSAGHGIWVFEEEGSSKGRSIQVKHRTNTRQHILFE